jgi:hypothetical protein
VAHLQRTRIHNTHLTRQATMPPAPPLRRGALRMLPPLRKVAPKPKPTPAPTPAPAPPPPRHAAYVGRPAKHTNEDEEDGDDQDAEEDEDEGDDNEPLWSARSLTEYLHSTAAQRAAPVVAGLADLKWEDAYPPASPRGASAAGGTGKYRSYRQRKKTQQLQVEALCEQLLRENHALHVREKKLLYLLLLANHTTTGTPAALPSRPSAPPRRPAGGLSSALERGASFSSQTHDVAAPTAHGRGSSLSPTPTVVVDPPASLGAGATSFIPIGRPPRVTAGVTTTTAATTTTRDAAVLAWLERVAPAGPATPTMGTTLAQLAGPGSATPPPPPPECDGAGLHEHGGSSLATAAAAAAASLSFLRHRMPSLPLFPQLSPTKSQPAGSQSTRAAAEMAGAAAAAAALATQEALASQALSMGAAGGGWSQPRTASQSQPRPGEDDGLDSLQHPGGLPRTYGFVSPRTLRRQRQSLLEVDPAALPLGASASSLAAQLAAAAGVGAEAETPASAAVSLSFVDRVLPDASFGMLRERLLDRMTTTALPSAAPSLRDEHGFATRFRQAAAGPW